MRTKTKTPKLKPGKILKKVISQKGQEIILRLPKSSDLKDFQELINSLVEEDDFILINKKMGLKEERKWLMNVLKEIKEGKKVLLCAVANQKVIGSCQITKGRGRQSHVGRLGIALHKNYRQQKIGSFLMEETLKLAQKYLKNKMITLEVFATNKRARNFYQKFGFKEYGKLPRAILRRGRYIPEILMYKEL